MNDITELRAHLFETLRALKDKEKPMDIDRARAISQVAGTLIDSARVEVEFLRVTGGDRGTGFVPVPEEKPEALPSGIVGITKHRIKG